MKAAEQALQDYLKHRFQAQLPTSHFTAYPKYLEYTDASGQHWRLHHPQWVSAPPQVSTLPELERFQVALWSGLAAPPTHSKAARTDAHASVINSYYTKALAEIAAAIEQLQAQPPKTPKQKLSQNQRLQSLIEQRLILEQEFGREIPHTHQLMKMSPRVEKVSELSHAVPLLGKPKSIAPPLSVPVLTPPIPLSAPKPIPVPPPIPVSISKPIPAPVPAPVPAPIPTVPILTPPIPVPLPVPSTIAPPPVLPIQLSRT